MRLDCLQYDQPLPFWKWWQQMHIIVFQKKRKKERSKAHYNELLARDVSSFTQKLGIFLSHVGRVWVNPILLWCLVCANISNLINKWHVRYIHVTYVANATRPIATCMFSSLQWGWYQLLLSRLKNGKWLKY